MSNKPKRSTIIPLCLLAYLAVMAWMGRGQITKPEPDYLQYFGIIGISLVIIVLLYFALRRKEALRRRREEELYGTYADEEKENSEAEPRNTKQP